MSTANALRAWASRHTDVNGSNRAALLRAADVLDHLSAGDLGATNVTQYSFEAGSDGLYVEVTRTGEVVNGTFNLWADVWAVRYGHECLNAEGEWDYEPRPSEREAYFYATHRFMLEHALELAEQAAEAKKQEQQRWLDGLR